MEPARGVAREEAVARDEAVARVGVGVAVADGDPGRVEVAVRYLEVRHAVEQHCRRAPAEPREVADLAAGELGAAGDAEGGLAVEGLRAA